jgi:hypothetical protein
MMNKAQKRETSAAISQAQLAKALRCSGPTHWGNDSVFKNAPPLKIGSDPNNHAPVAAPTAKRLLSSSANSGPCDEARDKPRATAEKATMAAKAEKTRVQASTER